MSYFSKSFSKFLSTIVKKIDDRAVSLVLIGIAAIVYNFLLTIGDLSLVGDAQRYNGYQAYYLKYSLAHFGQFGLWDPFLSSGMSWISHPGGALFSPFAWVSIILFNNMTRGSLFIFFLPALTAVLSYYFLFRVLGLRKFVAFCIALVAICNQYIFIFAANAWFEELFAFTLLPLTIGLSILAVRKRSYYYAAFAGISLSLNFLINSYYVMHYNVIALLWVIGVLGVTEFIETKGRARLSYFLNFLSLNVTIWAVFIGMSLVKLLPLLEFRSISSRSEVPLSVVESTSGVLTFSTLAKYIRDFIIPAGHTNWFTQWTNDLAVILVFFAAILLLIKRSKMLGIFLGLFAIGVWGYLANQVPIDLYGFLYRFLPGFSSNMFPYRFVIVYHFAFLVCIALALNFFVAHKNKIITFFGIVMGLIMVISSVWYSTISFNALRFDQMTDVSYEKTKLAGLNVIKNQDYASLPEISGTTSAKMVAALSKIVKTNSPEGRVYSNYGGSDNVLLHGIIYNGEIPSVQHSYKPIVPTYQYGIITEGTSTDSIENTKNRYKIFSVLNIRFQMQQKEKLEYAGCSGLDVWGAVKEADHQVCDFLGRRLKLIYKDSSGGIYFDSQVLSKFTIFPKAILVIGDNRFHDFSGFIAKKLMLHPDFDEKKLAILTDGREYLDDYSTEDLSQFPVVLLVEPKIRDEKKALTIKNEYEKQGGKIVTLNSTWKEYNYLFERSSSLWTDSPAWRYSLIDEQNLSLLFKDFKQPNSYKNINIEKNTPEDIIFNFETHSKNQIFQYSDSYYPGWHASLDGKNVSVYMADGLVKGVVIKDPGAHRLRLYYSPSSFKIGGAVTLATILILLSALIYSNRRKILSLYYLTKSYFSNPGFRFKKNNEIKKSFNNFVTNGNLFIKNNLKFIPGFVIILVLLSIYGPIIIHRVTSAGDLPYYWQGYIKELSLPTLWNPIWPTGLGGNQSIILPLKLYIQIPMMLFYGLGLSWELVQKIFLIITFIFVSLFSSYYFTRSIVGSLVYTTNTWILLVFSGGQMGIALAYAFFPAVIGVFINAIRKKQNDSNGLSRLQRSLFLGLVLSVMVLFDQRIAYIALLVLGSYWACFVVGKLQLGSIINSLIYVFIIPVFATVLLHIFWILPLILSGKEANYISQAAPSTGEATFFSFASFSNSIALLHPNWPDNIFGKTTFMQPEFLVIPLIAFLFLFFLNKKNEAKNKLLFFSLLIFCGAFLAKGVNEPFGQVYLWLFKNIPGFNMFRDPTKFYILIAIGFSIIIPISLSLFSQFVVDIVKRITNINIKKGHMVILLSLAFIGYWCFTIRPVFRGEAGGLFKEHVLPMEYTKLTEFIEKDSDFFRTLWVPGRQRFGYFSENHPSIDASDIYKNNDPEKLIKILTKDESLVQIENMAIKYVILPYDSEGEIFLNDRKYDEKTYRKLANSFEKLKLFKSVQRIGGIIIGEVKKPMDHFFLLRNGEYDQDHIKYDKINNSRYIVNLKEAKEGDVIVFSEKYDPGWIAKFPNSKTSSTPFRRDLNSFLVPESGDYVIEAYYRPEKFLTFGYIISFGSLVGIIIILLAKNIFKLK